MTRKRRARRQRDFFAVQGAQNQPGTEASPPQFGLGAPRVNATNMPPVTSVATLPAETPTVAETQFQEFSVRADRLFVSWKSHSVEALTSDETRNLALFHVAEMNERGLKHGDWVNVRLSKQAGSTGRVDARVKSMSDVTKLLASMRVTKDSNDESKENSSEEAETKVERLVRVFAHPKVPHGRCRIRVDGVGKTLLDVDDTHEVQVTVIRKFDSAVFTSIPLLRVTLEDKRSLRCQNDGEIGSVLRQFIRRSLRGRVLYKEDTAEVPVDGGSLLCHVSLDSDTPVRVDALTEIRFTDEEATEPAETTAEAEENEEEVSFDDVGGLGDAIAALRHCVDLSLHRPQQLRSLGLRPPRGVLLHGPPGTGKTLLARAVATHANAHFESIAGAEVVSRYVGESEEKLRSIFQRARKKAPSVVFIDELDALAPSREDDGSGLQQRLVATLLTLLDGVDEGAPVLVVGATNRVTAIDSALRRFGRFDEEIEVPVPKEAARLSILHAVLRKVSHALSSDDLTEIARLSNGYVGADLAALVRESALVALHRDSTVIIRADMTQAMHKVKPSALREVANAAEVPSVTWADVCGLRDVKQRLYEAVQWPREYREALERMRVSPPAGVLLYGPPGCSKTLLAQAVAGESKRRFLCIRGPELLDKYVGVAQQRLQEVFRRARQSAPSLVFFDEIDAFVTRRDGSPVGNRG
ncbi:MAG: hypothetical protein MHM6MM_004738 [Cercozoa sp. M6MM]